MFLKSHGIVVVPLTTREEGGGVREESEKRDRERVRQGSGEIGKELDRREER
jgi:hypothetical protein